MKVLIIGSQGMLGSQLQISLKNHQLFTPTRQQLDITKINSLVLALNKWLPDLVINCAAFTDVEAAEDQLNEVWEINALGPLNIIKALNKYQLPLIQLSTDYVFDGKKADEYNEDDQTHGINVYGQSKEMGEKNIIDNYYKYYIVRTSWLFGPTKQKSIHKKMNFVDKMLWLAKTQPAIKVVNDRFSKPTYTKDLSQAINNLITSQPAYGIYHLVNEDATSWYNYAKEIFKQANLNIQLEPVTAEQFFAKALRPKNSALKNNKLPLIRPWREALRDYLNF